MRARASGLAFSAEAFNRTVDVGPTLLKAETRRLYAADWAAFALWCRNGDQTTRDGIMRCAASRLRGGQCRSSPST